ncbi:vesicle transport through interaction with t-SNAREs homolog 1B-like [Panonychus citri]|uniref:vesicle transport through interaction with t-SNAREs homolog 1B-like n=1 Tax=Panonychus citri TaxID=50023 RepID=UPI0023080516|nr:vesicle transport through interaction with t-SNAREs homolog 1B-like [Panonychus citri]XP_053214348.1 vesicle transport through interaction with t-SNAREs homolog 1B-like [Panonychus citri]XP_053214349.1 vesicle transport through interaction with t-SNAREs homolog 1B-like [Panonychus citri]
MASSKRFEDLKDDYYSVKEKITNRLRQRISEGVLNNMFTEGDRILDSMKREVDQSPSLVKTEMNSNWATINGEWAKFKTIARTNPGTLIGGPSIEPSTSNPIDFETNLKVTKGIQILQKTGASLTRAQMIAKESENIGTEVIAELGQQRETLTRARERLDETGYQLKRVHVILRSINRRVITNKCLLIVIIAIEMAILACLIFWKFFR